MDRHQDDMPPELTTFVFLPVVCELSLGVMSSTKQLTDSKLFVIVREETMSPYKWKLACDWSMWEALKKWSKQWDHETLTRDALSGRRRHILLNAVETKLAEQVGEVGAAQVDSPDRLWKHFATAIREAVSETYPPQARQTKSRPRETQDAVEAMLCSRALLVSYRPLVLGKGHFNLDGVHTPCLHQALHDLLHVWRLSANYRRARKQMDICTKRDAKEKHDHILPDFQRAWQQRDLHQVWRLSRTLSGKRIGPKRRRYDAAKKVNPSQHEWMAFLQNEGPAGGCNANEVHWDDIVGNAENHTAVYLDYWNGKKACSARFAWTA